MNIFTIAVEVLLSIGILLFVVVAILSFLKFLKKDYFPKWKFLDYFSVGYVEHLYRKFIKGE